MKMSVAEFRKAGFEAKWGRTSTGRPCMFLRHPQSIYKHQREVWWVLTRSMWESIQSGVDPKEAFENSTVLGDVFSIRA